MVSYEKWKKVNGLNIGKGMRFSDKRFKNTMHIYVDSEFSKHPIEIECVRNYERGFSESFSIEEALTIMSYLSKAIEEAKLLKKPDEDGDD